MTTHGPEWRLIRSGSGDGYENMAVDEALMLCVARGDAPPTLRLYGWRPPGVSLGYFQEVEGQIDVAECKRRGYTVVRRPTGGRAILHDDEVTYSVAVRQQDLPGGERLLASYREISRGVEEGLRTIGVAAAMAKGSAQWSVGSGQQRRTPDERGRRGGASPPYSDVQAGRGAPAACFAKAARSDMTVDGRKIVGSAQVRRHGAILQHGSIPLRVNMGDVAAVIGAGDARPDTPRALRLGIPTRAGSGQAVAPTHRSAREALEGAVVSVSDAAGRDVTFEEMCEALVAGFEEGLGIRLVPGELTQEEAALAQRLREAKYGTDEWNMQRSGRGESATPPVH
jgi:lipoate-protein ligase A